MQDRGKIGFWTCTALVVGNVIGMGIFLLPSSMAPYGFNALIGWAITLFGCLTLARVFAHLSAALPGADGPYGYVRDTLGELPAYMAMWAYWISLWLTNAALATGVVGYMTVVMPGLAVIPPVWFALGLVWIFVLVNLFGVRAGGAVQIVTTALKLLPMLAIAALGGWVLLTSPASYVAHPPTTPISFGGVMAASTIALFAMLGIESASIPATRVDNPGRTIPRATMAGTIMVAAIYIVVCAVPLLLIRQDVLANASAPFALLMDQFGRAGFGRWLALFVVVSGLGALNGWTLLSGQLTHTMADNGVLPPLFARSNRHGTPATALVITAALASVMVWMSYSSSLVAAFTFLTRVVTAANLPLYLGCALALAVLWRRGTAGCSGRKVLLVATVATGYVIFAFVGIGGEPFVYALGLIAAGLPLYAFMRLRRKPVAPAEAGDMRDPRYDILFTPLKIGPVVAKNRFFQVPHCNGMGHAMPLAHAAMREVKAEGGWAVVSTEECEIHPSGDLTPYVEARLWDDRDIPALALMCDKVHAHGALAALELTHNGPTASNLYSREVLIAPSHQPSKYGYPSQARAMTKRDIREYRRWHREAAIRGQRAGMDIIYVYAAHDLSLPMHFLQRRRNQRSDEYGGSLENRVRLLREVLQDTKDAVGDRCAVALRFATEELLGPGGVELAEANEIVAMLAELPDLWDVNLAAWYNDSVPSRFAAEGAQEPFIDFVKKTTSKPVVGVGRFTSPDTMVSQLKRGVLDLIGCARPSIADPFLPRKIEEGRSDDIRECIGCNICVSGDMTISPIRCTQNPTMGEEWRKGWHPERIAPKRSASRVLVVGAGPAGLEAARALGQRGYEVSLAEARKELGGRVTREARMPGLAEWARVRDWRVGQLDKLPNVAVYRDSPMTAQDVLDFGAEHVVLATGCHWRRDGYGRSHGFAIPGFVDNPRVFTLDDLMDGRLPEGRVVIHDDDGFYYGSVAAEALRLRGCEVTHLTPDDSIAPWSQHTLDYRHIRKRMAKLGIEAIVSHDIIGYDSTTLIVENVWDHQRRELACDAVVTVTARVPDDVLYQGLLQREAEWAAANIHSLRCIGDVEAPGLIAHAVYAGHRYARELEEPASGEVAFKRHFHTAHATDLLQDPQA